MVGEHEHPGGERFARWLAQDEGDVELPLPGADACGDAELLAGFVERRLVEAERVAVEEHIAACAECRAMVDALRPHADAVAASHAGDGPGLLRLLLRPALAAAALLLVGLMLWESTGSGGPDALGELTPFGRTAYELAAARLAGDPLAAEELARLPNDPLRTAFLALSTEPLSDERMDGLAGYSQGTLRGPDAPPDIPVALLEPLATIAEQPDALRFEPEPTLDVPHVWQLSVHDAALAGSGIIDADGTARRSVTWTTRTTQRGPQSSPLPQGVRLTPGRKYRWEIRLAPEQAPLAPDDQPGSAHFRLIDGTWRTELTSLPATGDDRVDALTRITLMLERGLAQRALGELRALPDELPDELLPWRAALQRHAWQLLGIDAEQPVSPGRSEPPEQPEQPEDGDETGRAAPGSPLKIRTAGLAFGTSSAPPPVPPAARTASPRPGSDEVQRLLTQIQALREADGGSLDAMDARVTALADQLSDDPAAAARLHRAWAERLGTTFYAHRRAAVAFGRAAGAHARGGATEAAASDELQRAGLLMRVRRNGDAARSLEDVAALLATLDALPACLHASWLRNRARLAIARVLAGESSGGRLLRSAQALLGQALELTTQCTDDPRVATYVQLDLALLSQWLDGDAARAEEHLDAARRSLDSSDDRYLLANVSFRRGVIQRLAGQHDAALAELRRAAAEFGAIGDRHSRLQCAVTELAVLAATGKPEQAAPRWFAAIADADTAGNESPLAAGYSTLGSIQQQLQDFDGALSSYATAADWLAQGEIWAEALTLTRKLALLQLQLRQLEQAARTVADGRVLLDRGGWVEQQPRLDILDARIRIAAGDHESAHALLEPLPSRLAQLGDPPEAHNELRWARYELALATGHRLDQALAELDALTRTARLPPVVQAQLELTRAGVLRRLGRNELAAAALGLAESLTPPDAGVLLRVTLGKAWADLLHASGRLEQAARRLEQLLPSLDELDDTSLEPLRHDVLLQLATLEYALAREDDSDTRRGRALARLEQARRSAETIAHADTVQLDLMRGIVLLDEGRLDRARTLLGAARAQYEQRRDIPGVARADLFLARAELRRDRLDAARAHLDAAGGVIDASGEPNLQLALRRTEATWQLHAGQPAAALAACVEAADILRPVLHRNSSLGRSLSLGLRQQSSRLMSLALESLRRMPPEARRDEHVAAAYAIVQHFKGLGMAEQLAEVAHRGLREALQAEPDGDALAWLAADRRLANLRAELAAGAGDHRAALEAERRALESDQLRLTLALRGRLFAEVDYPAPATQAQVVAALPPGALLLEYAFGHELAALFVLTPDGATFVDLGHGLALRELTERVRAVTEALAGSVRPGSSLPSDLDAALAALTPRLLGPVARALADEPADSRSLVVAADGPLLGFPFEALLLGDASADVAGRRHLVQHCSVAYVHSGTTLRSLADSRAAAGWERDFVGFAATSVTGTDRPVLGHAVREVAHGAALATADGTLREQLDGLPASFDGVLSGDRVVLRAGRAASERALGEPDVQRARVLHLTCHAQADAAHEFNTYLVLAADAQADVQADGTSVDTDAQHDRRAPATPHRDGRVLAGELANSHLSAELVVLSACATGAGRRVPLEGVSSLSRAAFAAGARRVVSTLWPVRDDRSARLMQDFYTHLYAGVLDPATALAHAKRDSIARGDALASWSAYCLWAAPERE